ncbi:MAG: hypothetical protein AB1798_08985 [Spirochaetota bacterium]
MNRRKASIIYLMIFLVVYFLVFTPPTSKELIFLPVWAKDLSDPSNSSREIKELEIFPFYSEDLFGYISVDGEVQYAEKILYGVALAQSVFANYSRVSENIVFKDSDGRIVMNLETSGYPILKNGRIFVISTDRKRIAEWDDQENLLWKREYTSHITSLHINPNTVLMGFLNGDVELIDKSGKVVLKQTPERSRVQVIYGCAASRDDRMIAIISGIDPQRIQLIQKKDDLYKSIFTQILENEFRRNVYLEFSDNDRIVFFEGNNSLRYLDTKMKTLGSIMLKGKIDKVAFEKRYNLFFALSSINRENQIKVFKPGGKVFFESTFPGKAAFLNFENDSLFFVVDRKMIRVDLKEK